MSEKIAARLMNAIILISIVAGIVMYINGTAFTG